MSHQKHKALRASADRLKKDNDRLRRALLAEREFWTHFLFCPHCQLQVLSRLLCPEALGLKQEYQHRTAAALNLKKSNH